MLTSDTDASFSGARQLHFGTSMPSGGVHPIIKSLGLIDVADRERNLPDLAEIQKHRSPPERDATVGAVGHVLRLVVLLKVTS
jgi:hypothetical protein